MKKVLIRGTQAHESIGVHAMTISVMKCISEFIPDAKFTMWSVNPEIDYSKTAEQILESKKRII